MFVYALSATLLFCPPKLCLQPATWSPQAVAKLEKRTSPRKVAEVAPIEVKVQAVTTTAPTPSGTVSVVTLDLEQPTEFGTGLTEMLITALVKSDGFIIVDKTNATTGAPLIPQILIKGVITELKMKRGVSGLGGKVGEQGSFSESKVEATVGLDLRVIETSSGRVLNSIDAHGKAVSKKKSLTISKDELSFGSSSFEEGALGGAVRDAIKQAVESILASAEKVEWEAKVVEVDDTDEGVKLYINAGGKAGVPVGTVLNVRKVGKPIVDSETNMVLGRTKGKLIGQVKVVEVSEQFLICAPVDGTGFEKSDVVTLVKPNQPAAKPAPEALNLKGGR